MWTDTLLIVFVRRGFFHLDADQPSKICVGEGSPNSTGGGAICDFRPPTQLEPLKTCLVVILRGKREVPDASQTQ